jgi:BarA-like signal transduction histidine kinase
VLVNNEVPNAALAMKAESANSFSAERAMYIGLDGHASHGVGAPALAWYFAEGATSPPYQMWLLLANFSTATAHVTLTFMKEDGSTLVKSVNVGASTRVNVFVNSFFPFPGGAVATVVTSDVAIVAERSMYFGGSHNAPGVTSASTHWYLAEGYTGSGFQTWVLLLNPGSAAASVTLRFMKEDGSVVTQNRTVNPHSRLNVLVNDFLPGVAFSTQINSNQPIVAERAEYFGPAGARGGHASEAAVDPLTRWSFAEGSTQSPFTTYLLLMNPNGSAAHAVITYMREDGVQVVQSLTLGPTSRTTILVNQFLVNAAVSATVTSDQPIVAERAMYFHNNSGGTDSLGVGF